MFPIFKSKVITIALNENVEISNELLKQWLDPKTLLYPIGKWGSQILHCILFLKDVYHF